MQQFDNFTLLPKIQLNIRPHCVHYMCFHCIISLCSIYSAISFTW